VLLLYLVPGEPRQIRLEPINSTAVLIQWQPPLERELNGVIRGYQVYHVQVGDLFQFNSSIYLQ